MHTAVLQDWITVRGAGGTGSPLPPGATVVQDQDDWLDVSPYQDVFIWVACSEITGTPTIQFETSPTTDEVFFQAITGATTLTASATPTVVKVPMLSATTPIARFLRWRLTGGSTTWDATFRVVVACNSPGM